jgi:hypothetical protein
MKFAAKASIAVITLGLAHGVSHAAVIGYSDLPATIQSCVTDTSCSVSYNSTYDSGTASVFEIAEGSETNYLVRYALAPPSAQTRLDPPLNEALSGYLWMGVKFQYNASETYHPVTLFLDKVTPVPFSLFTQSGDLSLLVTTADLVTGSASRLSGLDGNNQSYDSGNLSGEIPVGCLAETCEAGAMLNLVQLSYGDFGSVIGLYAFNPSDTRNQVYTQHESYNGQDFPYNNTQSFYIAPVPVPGTICLFASGLVALLGARRRAAVG